MPSSNKIKTLFLLILFGGVLMFFQAPVPAAAQNIPPGCPGGPAGPPAPGTDCSAPTRGTPDEEEYRARNTCNDTPVTADNCPLIKTYLVPAINALSGAVGVIIVIMIVWGGIQYSSARDNPQEAASAKKHVFNAILALVIYIFMIAFLNWIVPGGVF